MMKSIIALVCVLAIAALNFSVDAKPAYARKEKKACDHCHSVDKGGGARGFRGIYYGANGLTFKGFDEKVEAEKAGVKPNSKGKATKPTKPYTGKAAE